MIRTRTLIGPLVVAAGLIVFGIHQAAASPAPSPSAAATMTPVVQIDDAAKTWHIAGTIQMMNGEFWDVQGFVVQVTNATSITGDLPSIGTYVDARGTVQPNGTWLATSLIVGKTVAATSSPTPSATPTPEDTSTPVPTAPATATATAPPSATATPLATSTGTNENQDSDSQQASLVIPMQNPHVSPPGHQLVRNVPPDKKTGAADNRKDPHPAHPAHPPAHNQNSNHSHDHGD